MSEPPRCSIAPHTVAVMLYRLCHSGEMVWGLDAHQSSDRVAFYGEAITSMPRSFTMKKTLSLTALVLSLAATATQAAPASPSEAIKIATNAGCMTCHHIEPGAHRTLGRIPIGGQKMLQVGF